VYEMTNYNLYGVLLKVIPFYSAYVCPSHAGVVS